MTKNKESIIKGNSVPLLDEGIVLLHFEDGRESLKTCWLL